MGQSPKTIEIKAKLNKWDLIQAFAQKGNHKQIEKTTYRLSLYCKYYKNICKCDQQWLNFQNIQKPPTKKTKQNKQTKKPTQLKNGQKTQVDISPKKTYRWSFWDFNGKPKGFTQSLEDLAVFTS